MRKINLFSNISKSFVKRSRNLVKVLLCTRNLNEHDFVHARLRPDKNEESERHCRDESEQSEEHQYLINGNQQQELEEYDDYGYYEGDVKEVITEDVMDMGFENREQLNMLSCHVKSVEEVEEEEERKVINEDVINMGFENKEQLNMLSCHVKSTVEEVEEEEERINEREMRMKVCSEVLWRLEELEEMESSDLDQVADLNEVVSYYSSIQNDFFVDLINNFIVDVSDVVRKSM